MPFARDRTPNMCTFLRFFLLTFLAGGGVATAQPMDNSSSSPSSSSSLPCLCVFDIDRTLTAKQNEEGSPPSCPSNQEIKGVPDDASISSQDPPLPNLVLSDLSSRFNESWCAQECYIGVISAGPATGDPMRDVLFDVLSSPNEDAGGVIGVTPANKTNAWVFAGEWYPETQRYVDNWSEVKGKGLTGPLVLNFPEYPEDDPKEIPKLDAISYIIDFFESANPSLQFDGSNVYFFDDKERHILPFQNSSFNGVQVSCDSRDDYKGLCGGTLEEVNRVRRDRGSDAKGNTVTLCNKTSSQ